jgi:hypothetical protein
VLIQHGATAPTPVPDSVGTGSRSRARSPERSSLRRSWPRLRTNLCSSCPAAVQGTRKSTTWLGGTVTLATPSGPVCWGSRSTMSSSAPLSRLAAADCGSYPAAMTEMGSARTLGDLLASHRRRRFVGRASEIELFRVALDSAKPLFSMLHVHGPAGIGKTRLLDVFAGLAADSGASIVRVDGRDLVPSPPAPSSGWPASSRLPSHSCVPTSPFACCGEACIRRRAPVVGSPRISWVGRRTRARCHPDHGS